MPNCCAHPESDHHQAAVCQTVIHYPSEDYPCLCTRFAAGEAERCAECEHARDQHSMFRVCTPANGDYCPCRIAR